MHTTRLKRMIFCVTATGNFAAMLNASSVNIALYKISQTFNVSVMQVQWVVLSYMIILTGLLTFFGRMGDMVDKRKLYAAGFALFGVGSVLSYFSGGFATLIASRAVQAVGGAILIANSFSIVSAVFKGKSRGRALGFLGAATHLAAMTAPSLSGLLMNFFKWQSIFVPNIAISFAGMFLALRFIPKSYGRAQMRADYGGTVLLVGGVAVLLLMIAQVPVWSWNSKETALCLGALIILFVLFGMRESAAKFPLIDFSLFSNRAFLFSNFALGISYLAMGGNTILFPFYAQQVLEKAQQLQPDVILCVGQAGGRSAVTPERVGINLRDAKICDNGGNQPQEQAIVPDGPAAYFSTVPCKKMVEAIAAAGLPAAVSNTVGTFVCNDVLYTLLHHFDKASVRVGFIHVPYLPSQGTPNMELADIAKALTAAIEAL